MHGIPRSSYASSAAKVAEQAAKVPVAPFQPRKGVHIETDPKADKKASAAAAPAGDDESIIEGLLSKLAAAKSGLPEGYKLSPVQVSRARCVQWRQMPYLAFQPVILGFCSAPVSTRLPPLISPIPLHSLRRTMTATSTWS